MKDRKNGMLYEVDVLQNFLRLAKVAAEQEDEERYLIHLEQIKWRVDVFIKDAESRYEECVPLKTPMEKLLEKLRQQQETQQAEEDKRLLERMNNQ